MVIVEAPMGEGKTEAALLAAEALAARSGADGCFVALPTRATTDAMFGRVLDWMRALPGVRVDTSVMLAHGTASLNDEYRGLLSPVPPDHGADVVDAVVVPAQAGLAPTARSRPAPTCVVPARAGSAPGRARCRPAASGRPRPRGAWPRS